MSDIELLGGDTNVPRSRLPLLLGGAALIVGLYLFRPRGSSSPEGGSPFDSRAALEFARVTSEARSDMARLTAANDLRRYELDLAHANTPAGLRQCYPVESWKGLPAEVRRSVLAQAKRGGSLVTADGDGGVCITPSDRGLSGDLQAVQRRSVGLFGSRSSGIGASAPPVPQPGIVDILVAYYDAVGDVARSGGYL